MSKDQPKISRDQQRWSRRRLSRDRGKANMSKCPWRWRHDILQANFFLGGWVEGLHSFRNWDFFILQKLTEKEIPSWFNTVTGWSCEVFTSCSCHQRCGGWGVMELLLWNVSLAGRYLKAVWIWHMFWTSMDTVKWLNYHSSSQFILIVAASSVGEELFYRAALQVCSFKDVYSTLYRVKDTMN